MNITNENKILKEKPRKTLVINTPLLSIKHLAVEAILFAWEIFEVCA
jgi:hypothetical protein